MNNIDFDFQYNKKIKVIKKTLKEELSKDRYKHTIGVANTCISLAMSRGIDFKDAYIAGLLHDCAKCLPDYEKILLCELNCIEITDIERKNPYLLHTKLGAFFAEYIYQVDDKNILSSIECHTTGKPNMSELDMIVFVADYIEPGRDKAKNLLDIRKMAFSDLEMATYMILKDTLDYLSSKTESIDPMTKMAFEYYSEVINNRN